jgi:hypothetical protein
MVFLSSNPNAIDLLKLNIELIYWNDLAQNPNAMSLIEDNIDKIDWDLTVDLNYI